MIAACPQTIVAEPMGLGHDPQRAGKSRQAAETLVAPRLELGRR
jgi:hypothetical protein